MDVRDNIKRYIQDHCFVQAEIARRAEMTPQQLADSLAKRRRLEANEFLNLCRVMEVSPDKFHPKA